MYEARQNKERVSRVIDRGSGNIVQKVKVRLKAKTEISTNKGTYTREGQNNGSDRNNIVDTIARRNETKYIADLGSPGNPMGACAEPHALAAALNDVKDSEQIRSISQYPAIAQKDERVGGIQYTENEAVLGCKTCQQWAPNIGKNKSKDPVSVMLNEAGS